MKYKLSLNEGPTLKRVVLIAVLLMAELIIFQFIEILATDRLPTDIEFYFILLQGLAILVTYCLTYLQKTE